MPVLQCVLTAIVQDAGPVAQHRRWRGQPDTIDALTKLIDAGLR
jgi:hypothetical protein